MKALVSQNENAYSYDRVLLGQRIVQVRDIEFPVAPQLVWVDCPDDCAADLWYYSNGQCLLKPVEPEPQPEE